METYPDCLRRLADKLDESLDKNAFDVASELRQIGIELLHVHDECLKEKKSG